MSVILDTMRQAFQTNFDRIQEIDAQLDPSTASRTKVLNAAVTTHQSVVDGAVEAVNKIFAPLTAEQIAAVHHSLRKVLKSHQDSVDTFVKENTPEDAEQGKLSAEEVARLNDERNAAATEAKAARSFILSMDPNAELPKVSVRQKGVKRASGPRLKGTYSFSIDGAAVDGHTLSAVSLTLKGKPHKIDVSVADIRKAILAQNDGNDETFWGAERERFEFDINGKHVVANLVAPSDSDEDEDVPEDEDDDTSSDDDDLFN